MLSREWENEAEEKVKCLCTKVLVSRCGKIDSCENGLMDEDIYRTNSPLPPFPQTQTWFDASIFRGTLSEINRGKRREQKGDKENI